MADGFCLDDDGTVPLSKDNTQVNSKSELLNTAITTKSHSVESENRTKQRVETQKTDQMSSLTDAPLTDSNVDAKLAKNICATIGSRVDGENSVVMVSGISNNKQTQSIEHIGLRVDPALPGCPEQITTVGVPLVAAIPIGADLKPPSRSPKDEEDIRKKRRCADRYDSSESSDSGVATLSCTDSSTASSDASDPGSPYSPSSCDDANQINGSSHTQRSTPHQWPWNTNCGISKTNNNNSNNVTINNNKRTLASDANVTNKKVRSNTEKSALIKKPVIITRHKSSDDSSAGTNPQTKITGFFKSQIKQISGLKRDLTNMVVRSKEFPKTDNIKKTCDYDVRALTGITQPLKKIDKKTAKVAPLVPISRKTSSTAIKKTVFATTKKPVTIAPRTIEPKRVSPPRLVPKLQEIRQKTIEQPKLSQPTVLLTTIRIPQSQQQHIVGQNQQQQIQCNQQIQQNAQAKSSTKMRSVYQLHPPVMPKLVQIPNILSKDTTSLVVNNGHIARVNSGPHYFLNGAVIKLQPMSDPNALNSTSNGLATVDNSMLIKSPTIAATVPFTSKSLPLQHTTLQQSPPQVQTHQSFATASTTQYGQPVFMATSTGLLLSTALPTVITSHLSSLQTINQQAAISTLHQYNQQSSGNVLPSINTILHSNQHNTPHTATFMSAQSSFHLQTQQSNNHISQASIVSNIPTMTSIPASKMLNASFGTTLCSSPQQFSINSLPPLITSTPTTSIIKTCISPVESSPILTPPELKLEVPELVEISLNVDTAFSTIPVCPQQKKDKKTDERFDLCSPAVPLLSPKIEHFESLPSPKSLVLEKIQQKKPDGIEEENLIIKKPTSELFKIQCVETEFQTASLPECAKSPILSQPKTIRFPAVNSNGTRNGNRRSDGRIIGVCYWDNCSEKYDTSSKLLDHLQTQHVNTQSGPFMCQWSGCKVHGRESCSRRWLERHVLSHGGTKPFKCIVDGCGLRFGSQLALQKHVNSHFNTAETKDQTAKRSSDPPVPKKLRVNGKKLRYRRQPFSARMFDYFDGGAMEILQHRLAHTATTANGPGGSIHFTGQQMAKRITPTGTIELLIKWHPCNIISDEWIAQKNVYLTKTIKVQSMSSVERISLHRYLKCSYKNSNVISSTLELAAAASAAASRSQPIKHNRKPPKTQPS